MDFAFSPRTTTVHVGDTITWSNLGTQQHSATASNGSFDTGILKPGRSASHTFTTPGTFTFFCQIHPFMHGTVVVLAAAGATPTPAAPTAPTPAAPAATAPAGPAAPAPDAASVPPAAQTVRGAPTAPATGARTLPLTGMSLLRALAVGALLLVSGLAVRRAIRSQR